MCWRLSLPEVARQQRGSVVLGGVRGDCRGICLGQKVEGWEESEPSLSV